MTYAADERVDAYIDALPDWQQAICRLTPQVLWVVTSRNSIDWDSSDLIGIFPAAGPRTWPELGPDLPSEPCQHVVSDLPDAEVLQYLRDASGRGGNPELGAEVIDRIRRGAHGLPLYLHLSVTLARESGKTADGALDPDTFGGSLPQLVTRMFAIPLRRRPGLRRRWRRKTWAGPKVLR